MSEQELVARLVYNLSGDRWLPAPGAPAKEGEEVEPEPDIEKIRADLDEYSKVWDQLAKDTDVKFPDDGQWEDSSKLFDDIWTSVKFYVNKNEMRLKFIEILASMNKAFATLTNYMELQFDLLSSEVARVDFQKTVLDNADKMARRMKTIINENVTKRVCLEFKKVYEADEAINALRTLHNRVVTEDKNSFVWKDIVAAKGNEAIFKYWKVVVRNTCIILRDAHFQYRTIAGVDKVETEKEIVQLRSLIAEISKKMDYFNDERKKTYPN